MKYRCKACGWECEDVGDMGMHLAHWHKFADVVYDTEEEKIRATTIPEGFEALYAEIDRSAEEAKRVVRFDRIGMGGFIIDVRAGDAPEEEGSR